MFRGKSHVVPNDIRVTAGFSPFATISVSATLARQQRSIVAEDDVSWSSLVNTPVLVTSHDSYSIGLVSLADLAGMLMQHGEFNTYVGTDVEVHWLEAAIATGTGSLVLQLALEGGNEALIKNDIRQRVNDYYAHYLEESTRTPLTLEEITEVGMRKGPRLRRWYKHVMESLRRSNFRSTVRNEP